MRCRHRWHLPGTAAERPALRQCQAQHNHRRANAKAALDGRRLSRGRCVLLGDAGTTLAILGAYVLAGELGQCDGEQRCRSGRSGPAAVRASAAAAGGGEAEALPAGAPQIVNPQTRFGVAVANAVLRLARAERG